MDHREALSSKASDRYLLGEMSELERFAFEEHYFQCRECAEDVRAGEALARGIRGMAGEGTPRQLPVSPRWWNRLTPALMPSAAAAALACVAGYQALVTIPGLRAPQAVAPLVLRAAARGEEQTVNVRGGPFTVFSLDVNAAEPGAALRYEMAPEGGTARLKGTATVPPPGAPLLIVAPHADLNRAGAWNLVLRTPAGEEIARYPFQIRFP
ncbi:MAG: zf-HC2 domain-containing protein [Acidobacteria bacterium]|nr:zf-HC2 domain-containing protein [Acidobacteriota bacterium]